MEHETDNPRSMNFHGEWLYGRRPVKEALSAGRRVFHEIILPPPAKHESDDIAELRLMARSARLAVRSVPREKLDVLVRGAHHQGVALRVSLYPYVQFADILSAVEEDENAIVVVLDHLEDPQNVGAVLRCSDCAGVAGIIVPADRACGITPAAVRASAGASEHLKIAKVVNIVRAIEDLQKAGVWFTALDFGDDARNYTDIDFKGRAGLVVGAEGAGVSRLVRKTCDFAAVLPMLGRVESLNAGVATGIALYEILRQRGVKSV